ncbi:MAG: phage virion morphogenesis protein [Deltaproteobacteria bacterium]|nr:MAG: phage virion morphogenesis protein [Deltaproteobacteria bacterium]
MANGFTVKIEDRQVKNLLARAMKASEDLTPAMKAIGEHLRRSTEENFAGEHAPDGTPWKPLSARYRKWKEKHGKGRKILTESSELRGSVHYDAEPHRMIIGSGKVYAAIHQLGGKAGRGRKVTIPPRPFLGIGPDDRVEINEIIKDHLRMAFSGR